MTEDPVRQPAPADSGPHILHFSLGPVQGFIQEARRTRDLWAGSFLLSWLSGQAMAAAHRTPGVELIFPDTKNDALFNAIINEDSTAEIWQGTLTNHFKAHIPADFDPFVCVEAVDKAWLRVAQPVYEAFVQPVLESLDEDDRAAVQAVWDMQIGVGGTSSPFWETYWVKGPQSSHLDGDDLAWLDRRKMTRLPSRAMGAESYLCTLMSNMEQLAGRLDRKTQRTFWQQLRMRISKSLYGRPYEHPLDLGDSERLCAVALVKRLFPALPSGKRKQAIGWDPGAAFAKESRKSPLDGKGRAIRFWPSTAHIAAGPWLAQAKTDPAVAKSLRDFAKYMIDLDRVSAVAEQYCCFPALKGLGSSAHLDGRVFFAEEAKDLAPRVCEPGKNTNSNDAFRKLQILRDTKIQIPEGLRPLGMPSQYFAVIAADGDSMGKAMRGKDRDHIPAALAEFSDQVRELFKADDCQGTLIYAGADDVQALAPVDTAISLACSIRKLWDKQLGKYSYQRDDNSEEPSEPLTLSMAISFVHIKRVLRWSIAETQVLLNDVAKDKMDRNAIAIQILRAGRPRNIWAAKWSSENDAESPPLKALQQLIEAGVGDNRTTYGLAARLPWLWPLSTPFSTLIEDLGMSGDAHHAIEEFQDEQLAGLIGALFPNQGSPEDWVVAGRFPSIGNRVSRDKLPMNPALLELLRFMKLHRQPVLLSEEKDKIDAA
ncbi:MAG: Cas10/Cmr2 second palm domain-containing protein [Parvularcula sp.]